MGKSGNRPTSWPKGTSGNPSGRPAGLAAFRELCRHQSTRAVNLLVEQLEGEDGHVAQGAAKILLEHGWGKPTQQIEVEGSLKTQVTLAGSLTEEQIVELAKQHLAKQLEEKK